MKLRPEHLSTLLVMLLVHGIASANQIFRTRDVSSVRDQKIKIRHLKQVPESGSVSFNGTRCFQRRKRLTYPISYPSRVHRKTYFTYNPCWDYYDYQNCRRIKCISGYKTATTQQKFKPKPNEKVKDKTKPIYSGPGKYWIGPKKGEFFYYVSIIYAILTNIFIEYRKIYWKK